MTNLNRKIKQRDRLFFDRYQYSVEFPVAAASCLRGTHRLGFKPEYISQSFEARRKLLASMQTWSSATREFRARNIQILNDSCHLDLLYEIYEFIKSLEDVRLTVNSASLVIYCNNLSFLPKVKYFTKSVKASFIDKTVTVTECKINRPRGTLVRQQSDYKYRLMFRHVACSPQRRDGIKSFLTTYRDHIAPSYALTNYLDKRWWKGSSTESHFFIDVNDDKLANMFELLAPGVLGEIYEIIIAK